MPVLYNQGGQYDMGCSPIFLNKWIEQLMWQGVIGECAQISDP